MNVLLLTWAKRALLGKKLTALNIEKKLTDGLYPDLYPNIPRSLIFPHCSFRPNLDFC